MINSAMILAAGLGTRMMPLTTDRPKAMVAVKGRPLIDYIIDNLHQHGVKHILVNVHYKKDIFIQHLKSHPLSQIITISEEETLLETGGGIVNALSFFNNQPFFCINCDSLWLNGCQNTLLRLQNAFDPAKMDGLLLLSPTVKLKNDYSMGDFFLNQNGILRRRKKQEVSPYLYTGIQIINPVMLSKQVVRPFSLNIVYNQLLSQNRLYGIVHDGIWHHISTPSDVVAYQL